MSQLVQRIIALAVLLATAPIVALAAIAIWLEDGRPVIFRAHRLGEARCEFAQLKLRTMVKDADALLDENGMATENRVLRVGQLLRKLSVDELPQLINVLRGEMALVGPRPLMPERLEDANIHAPQRFSVRPGLTGLAQISGRNDLPWSRRFELDEEYAKLRSFNLDLRILLNTLSVVATGAGVSVDRNADKVDDLRD